jgi:hypothetical protein
VKEFKLVWSIIQSLIFGLIFAVAMILFSLLRNPEFINLGEIFLGTFLIMAANLYFRWARARRNNKRNRNRK